MAYLQIRNVGVADYRAFTLLGVSTTRSAGVAGTIGQFGSGSKQSIALLLRKSIDVVVVCGNLKMTFFTKEQNVKGQIFNQVCVKYSGKDVDGTTKNSTEDLGFVTEMGVADWDEPFMAFREFVSNAIDGAIVAGGSHKNVKFEVVEEPRAKADYTSVFIEYTPKIEACRKEIGTLFLHYRNPLLLNCKCLPKQNADAKRTLIYKNGVLVSKVEQESICDYNLGNELTLDESRNASEWDVRHAVAKALRASDANSLVTVIKGVFEKPESFEAKLDKCYLENNEYESQEAQEAKKTIFKDAWTRAAGPKGVATSGNVGISSFVAQKGFQPTTVPNGWLRALETYGVPTETSVLTRSEQDGKTVNEPTAEMNACVSKVWKLFEAFSLTNGKEIPQVKGFTQVMDGAAQTLGYYVPGENIVYLHNTLGVGKMMFKIALEEIVHYTTGSDDNSRDIQDFLFNLVTEMAY